MGFKPDILIVEGETSRPLVVFEAKTQIGDRAREDKEIRSYMQAAQYPVAVIATPEKLWLYSDRFRTRSPDSIVLVGEYDLTGVHDRPSADEHRSDMDPSYAFAAAFQDWVEKLRVESYRRSLPASLREAVEEYLVPALYIGEVRAAGPRWRRREAAPA